MVASHWWLTEWSTSYLKQISTYTKITRSNSKTSISNDWGQKWPRTQLHQLQMFFSHLKNTPKINCPKMISIHRKYRLLEMSHPFSLSQLSSFKKGSTRTLSEDQAVRIGSKPTRGGPKILKIFYHGPHCWSIFQKNYITNIELWL